MRKGKKVPVRLLGDLKICERGKAVGILLYLECFERHRQKERTNRCAFPIRQIEGGEGVCISDAAHTDLHISQPQTRHEKPPFADTVASCA